MSSDGRTIRKVPQRWISSICPWCTSSFLLTETILSIRRSRKHGASHASEVNLSPPSGRPKDGQVRSPPPASVNIETPYPSATAAIRTQEIPDPGTVHGEDEHPIQYTPPVFADHDSIVQSTAIEAVLGDKPWTGVVPFFIGMSLLTSECSMLILFRRPSRRRLRC
jgi:hypothetical protein